MNTFILWLGGLLVAVFAALFAVPHFVDWNSYRGVFEEEATRVLGRNVRVGGSVNLRLLPVPYVRFEKVRIADNTGTLGAPFFSADGFTLWLSVPPLLRGVLEAKQVELERPVFNLAIDKSGASNWHTFRISSGALPFVPADVALQAVKISGGRVSVHLGGARETIVLSGVDGELSAGTLSGPYRFRGELDFETARHEVRFTTGMPEPDGSIRIKAVARDSTGGGSYVIDGAASNLMDKPEFAGQLQAKVRVLGIDGNPAVKTPPPAPAEATARAPAAPGSDPASGAADGSRPADPIAGISDDIQTALAPPPDGGHAGFDFKSKVELSALGFKLSEVLASFESNGRPQLVTGEVTGAWDTVPRLEAGLSARWLDIDRIAGSSSTSPLVTARILGQRLFAMVLRDWKAEARLDVDQANLGRDIVGDFVVHIAREAGHDLEVRQLSGALPGGVRFRTNGALSGSGSAQSYRGDLSMHGGSLARLLGWSTLGEWKIAPRADRAFMLTGKVALSEKAISLVDATADLGGRNLRGAFSQQFEPRQKLALTIAGDDLDIAPIAPGLLTELAERPYDFLIPGAGSRPAGQLAGRGSRWLAGYDGEMQIDIRAGRLTDGAAVLDDVALQVDRGADKTLLRRVHWATRSGLVVDADGHVDFASKAPAAHISGWIKAATPQSVSLITRTIDAGGALRSLIDPALAAAPSLAFGFHATIPTNDRAAFETRLDGVVGPNPVKASLKLAGGIEGWRKGAIDADLSVRASGLADLAHMSGHRYAARPVAVPGAVLGAVPAASETVPPTELVLTASGRSANDIAVNATVAGAEANGRFEGKVTIPATGHHRLQGRMRLDAPDLRPLLAAVSSAWRPELEKTEVQGFVSLDLKEGTLTLGPEALALGGTRVSGSIGIAATPGKSSNTDYSEYKVSGGLELSSASLEQALGLIVADQPPRRGAGNGAPGAANIAEATRANTDPKVNEPQQEQSDSHWTDAPFALSLTEHLRGDIVVRANSIRVQDKSLLADVKGRLHFGAGQIAITGLEGKALDGRFNGAITFDRQPAGVKARVAAAIANVDLAKLTALGADRTMATGKGSIAFDITGTGLSPRSLVTGVAGTGHVAGDGLVVAGLSTGAVHHTASEVIAKGRESGEPTADILDRELKAALATGRLEIGTRKIPIKVADGVAKLDQFAVAGPDGSVRNTTTVDLASLKFESDWQLSSNKRPAGLAPPTGPAAPLPEVSIVYVGRLATLTAAEPRISADGLDRELTVLRMERSVEKLERLRREDDERARQEQQRLEAIEVQKRRALEDYKRSMSAGSAAGEHHPASGPVQPSYPGPYSAPAQLGGPTSRKLETPRPVGPGTAAPSARSPQVRPPEAARSSNSTSKRRRPRERFDPWQQMEDR